MIADRSRLRFLAGINTRVLPETTDPGFEFRYIDIGSVGRGHLVAEPETMVFEGAPSRARRVIQAGDCLVSTVRTYLRAVLPVRAELDGAIASTGFAVLTPGPRLDARYLGWVAQSDPFIEEIVARSTGVSYPAINALEIGNLEVPTPPIDRQRAIADYLDTETARIDALIAKKRRLVQLLDDHEQTSLLGLAGAWHETHTATLRQLGTTVLTGPFGTQLAASEYVEGGIPLVNPTHIRRGRIEPEEAISVSPEVAQRLARHRLRKGDLVLGRKGDVGRSALITDRENGWICGSDSIAIRTDESRLSAEFLALLLSIAFYRQQLAARSTGATMANVNEPTLLSLQVPFLPADLQHRVVEQANHLVQRRNEIADRLDLQVRLLAEHRQALITAAVTGELAVPAVAAA